MATLSELTTPLTSDEVREKIYEALEAYGVRTSTWKPGAVARTIIAGASIVMAGFSTLQADIAKSGFLDFAEGVWLEIVARHVYGVEKNKGTFATEELTISNTGGGVYSFGIGDVTALNSTTGKTYRNTEPFSLGALETGVLATFQAVEIGSDSTAAIGQIDEFETTILGGTVTNAVAFVGQDEDTDPELRNLCRAKIGQLSPNGPADAYEFVAKSTVTSAGVNAGVTRVATIASGTGLVSVFVATASGGLTGSSGDLATPFGAVEESLQSQVVPQAVSLSVAAADALSIPVTYEAWVRPSSKLASELEAAISAALGQAIGDYPIGGLSVDGGATKYVFKDFVEAVITNALAEEIGITSLIDLDVTAPAADVVTDADEAPVAGVVTSTINVIQPS